MNRTAATIFAMIFLAFPIATPAAQPKVGASIEGGIFLYGEAVEIYWNYWIGFPVMTKSAAETHQARVTVVGEGKTAMFIGNLSINCENGKHFWQSAGRDSSTFLSNEKQADEIVPRPVVKNAIRLLCKRV